MSTQYELHDKDAKTALHRVTDGMTSKDGMAILALTQIILLDKIAKSLERLAKNSPQLYGTE